MRASLLAILIILASLQPLLTQRASASASQPASDATLVYDGIDVSSHQEVIDWAATATDKSIKFAYVKATEGRSYKSRHYLYNIEQAHKHGISVGSYHFFRPTVPVSQQFDNFTSIVKLKDQDLVPLIDIETKGGMTGAQIADSVLAFARLLERHYGCRPMIYTGSSFYNSNLQGRLRGYKLFIARYSRFEPKLADAQWTLWQFSERGSVNGIKNYVDLSRFNKGCTMSDILIKGRRGSHRIENNASKPVPPRKAAPQKQQPVPLSKKELKKQRKAKEKAQKEAAKLAREKARAEAEKAKKLEKEKKNAYKIVRENEKKAAEERREQERQKQEVAKKAAKKAAKEQKKQQEKAEKDRKREQERADKQKRAKQAADRQSANQEAKKQGKRINGSSADNSDD